MRTRNVIFPQESWDELWGKTKYGFKYVYDHYIDKVTRNCVKKWCMQLKYSLYPYIYVLFCICIFCQKSFAISFAEVDFKARKVLKM